MGRWNKNNNVEYKGINIGRRDLLEVIDYENAYWYLEYVKFIYNQKGEIKWQKNINYLIFLYEKLDNKNISLVDEKEAEEYVYYLANELNITSCLPVYIYEAGKLYDFLILKGKVNNNPFTKVKMYARQIDSRNKKLKLKTNYITEEHILKLKECLPKHLKLYVLFSVSTAAKMEHIRELKWEHIDFSNRVARIDGEILYFNDEVSDLLKKEYDYRKENGLNDYGYVFRSHLKQNINKNAPISKTTICRWCTEIGEILNIPNMRHLDFRHTMIKNLLSASGSVGMTSIISNYPNLTSCKAKAFADEEKNNDLLQEYKDICEL